nr:hypothetical protein [Ensifer sp. ENS08]
MEKVGSELRDSDQPGLGRYTQDLGNSIGRLARECEDRDLGEIASIAENYGRKQPLAFLGMAAIAGLAASRFLPLLLGVAAAVLRFLRQCGAPRSIGRNAVMRWANSITRTNLSALVPSAQSQIASIGAGTLSGTLRGGSG